VNFDLNAIAAAYNNGGHSIFGPSSSSMWLVCSGSLIPNILAQDDGTIEAAYGTVAHEVAEAWLTLRRKPKHMIGKTYIVYSGTWGYAITVDHQMIDYVQESVDRCILLPGLQMTEQRVDFSRLTPIPNQGGTLDFASIDGDYVNVIDHKFGKGVMVYAQNNTQAMLYALGLVYKHDKAFGGKYDMRRFRLAIHQPRLDHFDEWECSRDDLMEFAGYVRERAKAAWKLDAPRTPDPKACQFCKVKQTCAANARMQLRLVADQTDAAFAESTAEEIREFKQELAADLLSVSPVDPLSLTTEELERLRPYKRMVEGFWKTADHELLRRALSGVPMTRYKAVEGRSNRVFKNRDEAATHLIKHGCDEKDVMVTQVVSPAEAEALLIKAGHRRKDLPELLDGLVRKPPGKPTLAPLHDKRPALEDQSAIAFADSTDDYEES
jgi:hypothetical protein